jgi:prepilin peptidase CpaA
MVTPTTLTLGASLCAVALAIGWSAVSDVRAYVIPNWTSLLIIASFLVAALFTPYAPLIPGLLAGGGVLVLGLGMFALGWMGGGDVKLFSALALWCGPSRLASFTLVTSLAGAALALVMLSPLRRFAPSASQEARSAARQPMPYGVAIGIGGVWILDQYLRFLG